MYLELIRNLTLYLGYGTSICYLSVMYNLTIEINFVKCYNTIVCETPEIPDFDI